MKEENPFDVSGIKIDYKDDINAFNLYCLNCDKLYFSYVNKNLKENQEQYFLSGFVKKIYDNNNIPYYNMPLDETREYEDITTKRGMDNKEYIDKLINNVNNNSNSSNNQNNNKISSIELTDFTSSQMANFLNEPLSFRANLLFGYEDNMNEEFDEEFEPFNVNNLDRAVIFKELLIAELLNSSKDIKNKLKMENRLPHFSDNDDISCKEYDGINIDVGEYIDFINNIFLDCDFEIITKMKNNTDSRVIALNDIKFDNYKLVNNYDVLKIKKEDTWIYIPLKVLGKIKNKDLLSCYIVALMDVYDNKEDVKALIYGNNGIYEINHDFNEDNHIKYDSAKELLLNIIKSINDFSSFNKLFDSDLFFDEEKYEKNNEKISQLVNLATKDHGYWDYFNYKNLFDCYNQIGYSDEFQTEIGDMKTKMGDLIKISKKEA